MAGQADHPHVVAEVLAAELGADAQFLTHLQDGGFELQIAIGVARFGALGRQAVEIARRGQLDRLEVLFGAGAADDDGQMVGRAGGGAEVVNLGLEEVEQPVAGEDRGRFLVEEGLVGRAAALGHEQKFVIILALGIDIDLGRKIVAGVLLLEHRERCELAVAQVALEVGRRGARRQRVVVAALGPDPPALLAHDDRGAGVLAHREDSAGRDVGVLHQVVGDEAVVGRGLGIVEDVAQLLEMARSQEMVDVAEGGFRQQAQRFEIDLEDVLAGEAVDGHVLIGELPVGRGVGTQRKEREGCVGHRPVHCRLLAKKGTDLSHSFHPPATTAQGGVRFRRLRRRRGPMARGRPDARAIQSKPYY